MADHHSYPHQQALKELEMPLLMSTVMQTLTPISISVALALETSVALVISVDQVTSVVRVTSMLKVVLKVTWKPVETWTPTLMLIPMPSWMVSKSTTPIWKLISMQ